MHGGRGVSGVERSATFRIRKLSRRYEGLRARNDKLGDLLACDLGDESLSYVRRVPALESRV